MGEKDGGRLILENLPRSHHRILFIKPPDLSLQLQPPESMHFLKDSVHRAFLKDSLYKASRSEDPASRSQPPESSAQSGRVQSAPLPLYHSPTLYVEFSL